MEPSDLGKFTELVTALAAAFGRETEKATFVAYKIGLEDLPIAAINHAIGRALRECKFMPSPAELRELAGVQKPKERAVLAWEALDAAVASYGYYHSVDFDDKLINATVRNLGGWERICDLPEEEYQKWFRKDFERVYASLAAGGIGPDQAAPLLGYYAKQNSGNGMPIAPPVKIDTGLPALPQLESSQTAVPALEAR